MTFDEWVKDLHFDRLERIAARTAWDAARSSYVQSEVAEIRFESDCIVNGVQISAGTTLTIPIAGPLPFLLRPDRDELLKACEFAERVLGTDAPWSDLAELMPTLRAAIKKAKSMKPDLADRVERIGLEWHKGAILCDNDMRAIVAALRATSGYVPSEGWKLVPVEPTPEMTAAGYKQYCTVDQRGYSAWRNHLAVYKAMLAASPSCESQPASPGDIQSYPEKDSR